MIFQYYHLLLHHATTTAVQMAAPFPEIMDTPSYTSHLSSLAMPSRGMELFGFFVDCLFLARHVTFRLFLL
jgi:hypothetical protein